MNHESYNPSIPHHVKEHFIAQYHSGLSIKEYCSTHSLSSGTFYSWRKKYVARTGQVKNFTEIPFLSYNSSLYTVTFPSGISIQINRGTSTSELTPILDILSSIQYEC